MWRILSPTSISTPISPIFQICLCLLQHHCPLSSSYCSDITWLAIMTNIDAQYHQGDHLQWQYIHILQPLPSNSWICSTITPSPRTKSITAILDTSLIVYTYLTLSSWLSNAATPSAHAVPVDCLIVHHCYTHQWWCHHVPYYHSLATARSCSSIHSSAQQVHLWLTTTLFLYTCTSCKGVQHNQTQLVCHLYIRKNTC